MMGNPVPVSDSNCKPRYITSYLYVDVPLMFANGYPTTENDTIYAIVERPEVIAENSSITCALKDCVECPIFTSTPCMKL